VAYPEPLEKLVQAFERLPGVGRRTAERLAFHVLADPSSRALARAIDAAVASSVRCRACGNVAERDPCPLCSDETRDARTLLVVEEPRHVEALERAGCYRGRYYVLMGVYNPAEGQERGTLALAGLVERARRGELDEVILGTDPDAEGEATAHLVLEELTRAGARLRITRLARGLPAGSAIDYLHRGVLEDALAGRVELALRSPRSPRGAS
jgi:recombination protein RecR